MEFQLSNFFQFVLLEFKGLSNYNGLYNNDLKSDSNLSNQHSHHSECRDSSRMPSSSSKNLDVSQLDMKLLRKSTNSSSDSANVSEKTDFYNFNFVVDSIPQNLLVHMARLPYFFERLIYHSVGICLDSVLFELTFMPIQAVTAVSYFLTKFLSFVKKEVKYMFTSEVSSPLQQMMKPNLSEDNSQNKSKSSSWTLDEDSTTLTEVCGCVRFFVLVATVYIFSFIDTSKVYHNIKAQPVMKLYVIFNILEICERLCRSFSRDVMDSLIRTTIKIFIKNFTPADSDSGFTKSDPKSSNEDVSKILSFRNITKASDVFTLFSKSFKDENGSKQSQDLVSDRVKSRVKSESDFNGGFLTAKANAMGNSMQSFNTESILSSCRKYSDRYNIYYKFVFLYIFVVLTISFHTFLHLVRVLSLNIAINSPEYTMFLLLITNNFAEIKSTVFKKHDQFSLFVIFASDAVERCHLFFDGLLVLLKMSTCRRNLKSYITVCSWLVLIYCLEVLIDFVKHSYLIKFNKIRSETFEKYNNTLIADNLLSRSTFNLDSLTFAKFKVPCKCSFSFSHISARRLGFISSPIVTLVVCSLPKLSLYFSSKVFLISFFCWLSLLLLKVSMSILLTAYSIKKKDLIYSLDPQFYKIGAL